MNMKRKIRKAFKSATPNILDRLSPAVPKVIPMETPAPAPEEAPSRRWKLREFVAVAAALALIIGSLGSGIQYIRQSIQFGNTGDTPTLGDHGAPVPDPTESTRVPVAQDEIYKHWSESLKLSIEPSDKKNIIPTGEFYQTFWGDQAAYVIPLTYKGYLYEMVFSMDEGLLHINIPQTNSIKEDEYITEIAARSIAYTQVDDSLEGTNYAWYPNTIVMDQNAEDLRCYYVTLQRHPINDYSNYEYKTFCVNACTGEILDVEEFKTSDHSDIVTIRSVEISAWSLVLEDPDSLNGSEKDKYTVQYSRIKNGDLYYYTEINYGGFVYLFENAHNGKLLSLNVSISDGRIPGQHIAKNVALEIVCLANGIEMADGQSAQILLDGGFYRITISGDTYAVNSVTGEVLDVDHLDLVDLRDIALAYQGISLNDCTTFFSSPFLSDDGHECIEFSFLIEKDRYDISVRTSDGTVVDAKVKEDHLLSFWYEGNILSFTSARDAALKGLGLSLDSITSLRYNVDREQNLCTFTFESTGQTDFIAVDLVTGEVIHLIDLDILTLTVLRDKALAYFDIDMSNCWSLAMEIEDPDTEYERVRFFLHCDGAVFVAAVRLSDAAVVDSYTLMATKPVFLETAPAVDWQTARDIALKNCGLSLDRLTYLSVGYDQEHQIYDFIFGIYPEEYACSVDAVTGEMTNPVTDSEYIGESAAWEVMLSQVPEDVQAAFLAASNIQTACSLTEKDGSPCYYLWLSHDVTNYEAFVDAKTGQLLFFQAIAPDPEPPQPPDGNIGPDLAVEWAIDALADPNEVKVTVLSCDFVESDEGDYYLVCYFAGGCYYRVAIGAYGAGHLWHEGYDYEDTLNSFSEKFAAPGTWENMALTHVYEGPDQLQLAKLFYNGVGDDSVITAEELALLQDAGYPGELDIIRLPAAKMEEILDACFGCAIEDASAAGLLYLESTDCYYLWHNDALAAERFYALGLIQDGDIYHMYYLLQNDSQVYAMTFQQTDNGILIYNNLTVGLYTG